MQYIGNIFSENKIADSDLFNVTDDEEKLISGLPLLITGFRKAVSMLGDTFDISNKNPYDDVFWTYGRMEHRDVNEIDISNFKVKCLEILKERTNYSFISLLIDDNIDYEWLSKHHIVYISNDMVYSYVPDENTSYGISLRDSDFVGIERNTLISKLLCGKNSTLIKYDDIKQKLIKNAFKIDNFLIPVIFS